MGDALVANWSKVAKNLFAWVCALVASLCLGGASAQVPTPLTASASTVFAGDEFYSCFIEESEDQNFTLLLKTVFPPQALISLSNPIEERECPYVKTSTNHVSVICSGASEPQKLGFNIFLDLESLTGQWTTLQNGQSSEVYSIRCKRALY